MKYIGYWEFDLKDWDEAWKKNLQLGKDVNENPDKYPEFILGPHCARAFAFLSTLA